MGSRINNFLNFIGSGRALELYLSVLKISISVTLTITNLGQSSPPFADIVWNHATVIVIIPFLCVGTLQLSGWIMNIMGLEINWIFRFVGAGLAVFMWTALLSKATLVSEATWLIPVAGVSLPFSMFLMWRSWHRLPVPGAYSAH